MVVDQLDERRRARDASTMDIGVILQNTLPLLHSPQPINLTKHDLNGLISAIFQL